MVPDVSYDIVYVAPLGSFELFQTLVAFSDLLPSAHLSLGVLSWSRESVCLSTCLPLCICLLYNMLLDVPDSYVYSRYKTKFGSQNFGIGYQNCSQKSILSFTIGLAVGSLVKWLPNKVANTSKRDKFEWFIARLLEMAPSDCNHF